MSNELENQLPQGAEEEIVDDEEVNLPDLSDMGSLQQEFEKNAPASSNPIMKAADNVSGLMEDAAVNVRDFIDNNLQGDQRSKEDIRADREAIRQSASDDMAAGQEVINQSTNPVAETLRAGTGGLIDAYESLGEFAGLSKQTLETTAKSILGMPVEDEDNPFNKDYKKRTYLEVPDVYEPENQTPLGNFGRALVEFGLLTKWTGNYLGGANKALLAPTGAKLIPKAPQIIRSGKAFVAGNRILNFLVPKTIGAAKTFGTGSLAELISSSSEQANLANAAQEYVPWLFPGLMQRLAIDEDDTAWVARMKTTTIGGGANYVGDFLGAFVKGSKLASKKFKELVKKGDPAEVAAKIANKEATKEYQQEVLRNLMRREEAAEKLAEVKLSQGTGIDPSDPLDKYIRRHLDEEDLVQYDNVTQQLDDVNVDNRINARATIEELTSKAKSRGAAQDDVWDDVRYSSTKLDSENAGRQPDPNVNPDQFDDFEKSTYARNVDAVEDVVKEARKDNDIEQVLFDEADILKAARQPVHSSENVFKSMVKRSAGGDKNLEEIMTEVVEDIKTEMLRTYKADEYEDLAIQAAKRAEPILGMIANFTKGDVKNIAKEYTKSINALFKGKGGSKPYRIYSYGPDRVGDGKIIKTIDPIQKDANMIVLKSLAKTMSNLATGALEVKNNLTLTQNFEKLADLMKVVTLKTKEQMYAWGIDGQLAQSNVKILDKLEAKKRGTYIAEAAEDAEKLHTNLINLVKQGYKTGDMKPVEDLITIFHLTDGDVLTLNDIGEYLRARVFGGSFLGFTGKDGQRFKAIPSKLVQELIGITFNGLLARIKTPVKAVISTGYLAGSRPFMRFIGLMNPLSISRSNIDAGFLNSKGYKELFPNFQSKELQEKEIASALFQMDSTVKSLQDSLAIFSRNYKLGLKGADMDYAGKYAIERRTNQWKGLSQFLSKQDVDPNVRLGYYISDFLHKFNTNPAARHSTIAMGAGDASARYVIGMQRLVEEAFHEAMDAGASIKDFKKFQPKFEELVEKKIFRIKEIDNGDGTFTKVKIVSDKLARLAGDEATLTKNLDGLGKAYNAMLKALPGSELLFKFITPSINGLKLVFDHSPAAALFNKKYHALLRGDMVELQKLGIKQRNIPGEIAQLEGQMVFGTGITVLFGMLAATGKYTGDLPRDPGEREAWIQGGIKPNSVRFGVPFTDEQVYFNIQGVEIFSTLARVIANIVGNAEVIGETATSQAFARVSNITASLLVDNGPLGGITEFSNIFTAENKEALFGQSAANVLGSFMPMSGSFSDFSELIDGSMKELESVNERILYRASVIKPMLPQKYEIYNPERQEKKLRMRPDNFFLRMFGMVSPIGIDFEKDDPVVDALIDIRYDVNANLTSIDGEQLTGPEQSEIQRLLAIDPIFRRRLENKINEPAWKESLEKYKKEDRKVKTGPFSKDGVFGIIGDDKGGYNYKEEQFYTEIDQIHTDAKKRAKQTMLLPGTKFSDLSDKKSLKSRINVRKAKTILQNKKGYTYQDINNVIEKTNNPSKR
tara:strand:- start:44 stop:4642 length:4599 start_codon:yes stop_codon:yes gene_type:complete